MSRDYMVFRQSVWHYFLDHKEVPAEEYWAAYPLTEAEKGSQAGSSLVGWKPIVSDALACHPKQVKEAEALAKARGVPTEFQPDGRPIFTSRSHRREYMKQHGFHDNDGGYNDG